MKNKYLSFTESYVRLRKIFEEYGKLYIAYDFDSTIYPYDKDEEDCNAVQELLRVWRNHGHFILFTHRDSATMDFVLNYIKERHIPLDEINSNVDVFKFIKSDSPKPYWNILLDDKAGLNESYNLLYNLAIDIGILKR